ncbi:hypothetical protein [Streptomyces sp. HUAS TT7]|uniref:hypothetical protein n=1 Tax=Streptomyces sp. HUAS TT7 TaxID=3447507 RepID=UPI003F65EAD7
MQVMPAVRNSVQEMADRLAGRTVIALAQLSVLLLTPVKALLVPVVAMGEYPRCDSVRGVSALCLGGDALGMEPRGGCGSPLAEPGVPHCAECGALPTVAAVP